MKLIINPPPSAEERRKMDIGDILRELKWAYQRAKYGYDDRIKWGFDEYFSKFIKPLKEFCEDELKSIHPDNLLRIEICKKTLELIKDVENMTDEEELQNNNATSKLWKYVGENIGWYWD